MPLLDQPPAQPARSAPTPAASGPRWILRFLGAAALGLFLLGLVGTLLGPRVQVEGAVGVVELIGPILESRKVSERLWELADAGAVALVLRIDSPGGGAGASQEIYEEVLRLREETGKPVVASMGGVAASGGYYAAIGCDRIVANAATITGSIGVITEVISAPDLLQLAQLKQDTFKSGALKDTGNPFRPMTDDDRALFSGLVNDIFEQFRDSVRKERELSDETVALISDGRVVSGRQAKELGLVDEIGNLGKAVRMAYELAGYTGRPRVVYPHDDRPVWLRSLVGEAVSSAVSAVLERTTGVRVDYRAPVGTGAH